MTFSLATMRVNWANMRGMMVIQRIKPILLGKKSQMSGSFMICTATSGNGWKMTGMITTMVHLMTGVPG
ncbi:MAG: hypothetical protein AMJ56_20095 [Anaerolineae bacterium SG8_19]|nr:MAG: hypothetical protein AMJ56_20095 [Anaerolineae bacterium SG8_19]